MKILVVTNCTARKSKPPTHALRARTLAQGSLREVSKEWRRRLSEATDRALARNLYQGRAFQEATRAARLAETPLHIVSAGLGLITEDASIPSYSLTISEGDSDAILDRFKDENTRPAAWWKAVNSAGNRTQDLAMVIRRSPQTLFVLALSSAYLELVVEDLLSLSSAELSRVRLTGPRRVTDVPEALRTIHLPYDDRLDGARSPIRGTESDFPQRAALHFVQLVLARKAHLGPQGHKQLVLGALQHWPRKTMPKRKRLPEPALRRAIGAVLRKCNGQWSKALRVLRDDRKIACEQKRFRKICEDILEMRA
jgi:hypothetical protein